MEREELLDLCLNVIPIAKRRSHQKYADPFDRNQNNHFHEKRKTPNCAEKSTLVAVVPFLGLEIQAELIYIM